MVTIFSCCFSNQKTWEGICNNILHMLPGENRPRVLKMVRKEDQMRHLLGRMLLKKALDHYSCKKVSLADIRIGDYGKPYLPGRLQFSISHSGEYVFCAVSSDEAIGIDIEQIKAIDFEFVQNTMHKAEWRTIYKSDNPLKAFYLRWCMKEAALKADGRGVYIPLEDIHMGKDFVEIQNRQWYLTFLTFNPDYCGCVATPRLYAETELIVVDPKDFV